MNAYRPNPGERVCDVHFTEDTLAVDLADGRTIIVPITWYPQLLDATLEQLPFDASEFLDWAHWHVIC